MFSACNIENVGVAWDENMITELIQTLIGHMYVMDPDNCLGFLLIHLSYLP